jgi:aminomethyltransferase
MNTDAKKTPLNEIHRKLGGKMVDFAGWDMPVEYSGLRAEHIATRNDVGLFDVSHMGEVMVEGEDALAFLQKLLTNDVSKCALLQAQYNMMLNEAGGVIDDLIIYRIGDEKFLLVVNASNKDKDFLWISKVAKEFSKLSVKDVSAEWAQIAVQGPKAVSLVQDLFPESANIKKFRFQFLNWKGAEWMVARTGYTGEDGFEIYGPVNKAVELWDTLMAQGQGYGILPCALGARNTLRIEAGLPLYGNEINDSTLPLNIGMNWAIKTEKSESFFGQKPLQAAIQGENEAANKRLVGLISLEKAIPRDGYRVLSFDKMQIGAVTSGTYSPSLNQPIAMALVDKSYSNETCLIEVRKNLVEAKIVNLPFVKKK